jgi:hypothetical protein
MPDAAAPSIRQWWLFCASVGDTLDQPHLPERTAAVERLREEQPDQLGQLAHRARSRHRDAVHVAAHVEVGVVHQPRAVEAACHLAQLARVAGRQPDTFVHHAQQLLEAEVLRLARVEHGEAADVLRHAG